MTREEAASKLKWYLESNLIEDISGCEGLDVAIELAIKALKEPEEPMATTSLDFSEADYQKFSEQMKAAPLVFVPERKKGKWIGGELGYCTCCGHEGCYSDMWDRCETPYCPNCGARIEV